MRRASVLLWLAACSQGLDVKDEYAVDGEVTTDAPLDSAGEDPAPDNAAPVADAGPDQSALVAEEIGLDGLGSYDPDGEPLAYEWSLVDQPTDSVAELLNAARPTPSFYADRAGVYLVELAVSDTVESATDTVEIVVDAPNEGPVANAGPDQDVAVGVRVVLNGSASYDSDGDPLDFEWTFVSRPGGSTAALDAPTSALPGFTADLAGLYVLDLVVTDGVDVSQADRVEITASSGGDDGCISCVTVERELRRRHAAGLALVGLFPLTVILRRRRR